MTHADQREKLIEAMAEASTAVDPDHPAAIGPRSVWPEHWKVQHRKEMTAALAAIAEQGYAVVPRDFRETPSETFEGTLSSPDYQIAIRAFVATYDIARSETLR